MAEGTHKFFKKYRQKSDNYNMTKQKQKKKKRKSEGSKGWDEVIGWTI